MSKAVGKAVDTGRLRPIAVIVIVDIAAPLVAYWLLRSAGLPAVTALLLSGVFPAAAVATGVVRHRRLDVAGAVVLASIVAGAVLGLVSHSAKPVLAEGSVITAVFGLACLVSLRTRRPLMYALALEFTGPDSPRGQEMIRLWRHEGFRHVFRVITAVWGAGFLLEAAVRLVIVEHTSTGTALASSQVTPFLWAAVLSGWTVAYGAHRRKAGERAAGAAGAAGAADQDPGPGPGGSAAAPADMPEVQRSSTFPTRQ
jgi:intracellular septation protein A